MCRNPSPEANSVTVTATLTFNAWKPVRNTRGKERGLNEGEEGAEGRREECEEVEGEEVR